MEQADLTLSEILDLLNKKKEERKKYGVRFNFTEEQKLEMVRMNLIDGLSYPKIAKHFGCSDMTVRKTIMEVGKGNDQ